jgi:hypothetical protein
VAEDGHQCRRALWARKHSWCSIIDSISSLKMGHQVAGQHHQVGVAVAQAG